MLLKLASLPLQILEPNTGKIKTSKQNKNNKHF